MHKLIHRRKAMIALAIAVAFVAVVVPTCQMVGCSMSVGSTMPWGHQAGPGFFGDCGGAFVINTGPTAVVPAGLDPLMLVLLAAALVAVMLTSPRLAVRRVRITDAAPPPPPEDPRGMRFRL